MDISRASGARTLQGTFEVALHHNIFLCSPITYHLAMFPAIMRELLMDKGTLKSVTYTAQL